MNILQFALLFFFNITSAILDGFGYLISQIFGLILRIPYVDQFFERFTARIFHKNIPPELLLSKMSAHSLAVSRGEAGNWLEKFDKGQINDDAALLIEGKILDYAKVVLPPEKFASCYNDIPDDLIRDVISDGRALNGEPPSVAFGARCLDKEFLSEAWSESAKAAGIVFFVVLTAAIAVASYYVWNHVDGAYKASFGQNAAISTQAALKLDPFTVATQYRDVWGQSDIELASKGLGSLEKSQKTSRMVAVMAAAATQGLFVFAISVVSGFALAWIAAQIWFVGKLRGLTSAAVARSIEPMTHTYREAVQRWRWRLPEREMQRQSYEDQVHFATQIDKSPTIEIGTSLGVMNYRGHLLGAPENTSIKFSILDLLQHVEVLGGSGEGKSRNVYRPIVQQLLQYRKDGYPIALYATDDKGAIGADILDIARKIGLPESDFVVIGTNPTNEYFVDLLDGLQPLEVADIIKSVASQMGAGNSTDDFWPEMASDLLMQVAIVLQASELTTIGVRWSEQNGQRLYSLLSILQVARSDELILQWSQVVCDALESDYAAVAQFDGRALRESVEYLVSQWLPLVEATKAGISSNLRRSLKTFVFKEEIAEGFATGWSSKKPQLPVNQLIGNTIKIVNISQLEHGSAGRLVAIMLKTLLFKLARSREQADPASAKRRLNWWFDPKPGHGGDEQAITVFLADEFQALVTASQDGLSDALAWNVLRSAGIAGILLSQSPAAYRFSVGAEAYNNMSNNWRSKIYLRSEDTDLLAEAQKLAGKTMRFHSLSWQQRESSIAIERESGVSIDSLEPASAFISDGSSLMPFGEMNVPSYSDLIDLDNSWLPVRNFSGDKDSYFESTRAVYWRQEDQINGVMQHGLNEAEALHADDIMSMGRGRAFVMLQRAGGTVVEIVKLGSPK